MIPLDKKDIDWSKLYGYINQSVQDKKSGKRVKDFEHYVFEWAMEAVFGDDVWEEYNKLEEE